MTAGHGQTPAADVARRGVAGGGFSSERTGGGRPYRFPHSDLRGEEGPGTRERGGVSDARGRAWRALQYGLNRTFGVRFGPINQPARTKHQISACPACSTLVCR